MPNNKIQAIEKEIKANNLKIEAIASTSNSLAEALLVEFDNNRLYQERIKLYFEIILKNDTNLSKINSKLANLEQILTKKEGFWSKIKGFFIK